MGGWGASSISRPYKLPVYLVYSLLITVIGQRAGYITLPLMMRPKTEMMLLILLAAAALAPAKQVRLLSQLPGRFIHVSDTGSITARGSEKTSAVFNMYLKNSTIQFELKSKPGIFLMLKEQNYAIAETENTTLTLSRPSCNKTYTLVVDHPSEPFLTEWEISRPCGALVQTVDESTSCFIAFDSGGELAGP